MRNAAIVDAVVRTAAESRISGSVSLDASRAIATAGVNVPEEERIMRRIRDVRWPLHFMGAQRLEQIGRGTAANAVAVDGATAAVSSRAGYFRWVICALLLAGTTKNYMDRQV